MKIYFTSSTAQLDKYRNDYYYIRNILIDKGHVLTRDWLPLTDKNFLSGQKEIRDVKKMYQECIVAIKESDLVIIEDTVSNFSTGHQITVALQNKKPTLVLWQGKKHRQFNQMFIHGVDSDILEIEEYDKKNLEDIIEVFIAKYEKFSEKNRFHLVLTNIERSYLDWSQYVKGKSRTKVIKESLRKIIDQDEDYKKYLQSKNE